MIKRLAVIDCFGEKTVVRFPGHGSIEVSRVVFAETVKPVLQKAGFSFIGIRAWEEMHDQLADELGGIPVDPLDEGCDIDLIREENDSYDWWDSLPGELEGDGDVRS